MKLLNVTVLGIFLGCLWISPVLAQEAADTYPRGYKALELFDGEAMADMPRWIQIWLNVLSAVFLAGVLFVWKRVEARWAVGGFLASTLTVILFVPQTGLVPLGGLFALIHVIFWTPALVLLLTRRPFLKERSLYALWSGLMTAVIAFSFIFDIPDSAIYLNHMLLG